MTSMERTVTVMLRHSSLDREREDKPRPRSFSYSGGNISNNGNTTMGLMSSLKKHTLSVSEEELRSDATKLNSSATSRSSVRSRSFPFNTSPKNKQSPLVKKKQRRKSSADMHYIINEEEDTKSLKEFYGSRTSLTSDPSTGQPLEEVELEDKEQSENKKEDCLLTENDENCSSTSLGSVEELGEESDKESDTDHNDNELADCLTTVPTVSAQQPQGTTPPPTQVDPVEATAQPLPLTSPVRIVSNDIGVYVPGIYPTLLRSDQLSENSEYVVGINTERTRAVSFSDLSSPLLIV